MINGKIVADMMRAQYLQLGLPGDVSDSSNTDDTSGISGSSFSDLLSNLMGSSDGGSGIDPMSLGDLSNTSDSANSSTNSLMLAALGLQQGSSLSPWSFLQQSIDPSIASAMNLSALSGTDSTDNQPVTSSSLDHTIQAASTKYGVPESLIKAVIKQESDFQPTATSSAGALGLMQLMPATAHTLGVQDPFDPTQNIEGGTKYLKQLLDRYNGRTDLALAAYNAGPGAVDMYGGVPPYAETQNYVQSILNQLTA